MDQGGGERYKVFNPGHCAPGSDISDGSCLDRDLMVKVSKALNKINKDQNIDCKQDTNNLHECICKCIKDMTGCSSEACWLNLKSLMKLFPSMKKKMQTMPQIQVRLLIQMVWM